MLSFLTAVFLLDIDMDFVTKIVNKFMQMTMPEEPNEAERKQVRFSKNWKFRDLYGNIIN